MASTLNYIDPANPGPYCSGDIRFNVNTNMTEIYDGITWNVVPSIQSNVSVGFAGSTTPWFIDEHEACINSVKHFSSMMDSNGIHRLTDNPAIADAYNNAIEAVEQLAMILSLTKKQK
jgi:hypothetical protein